jgi:uncharacterized protein YbjQ (UPF0145 family)
MFICPKCRKELPNSFCPKCGIDYEETIKEQQKEKELLEKRKQFIKDIEVYTINILNNKNYQIIGLVHSHVAFGANVIKDLFASGTDFFGGRSKSYESVIDEAKNTVLIDLKYKTYELGGNQIIGFKMDIETIGQSIFLINAYGTAIKNA